MNTGKPLISSSILFDLESAAVHIGFGIKNLMVIQAAMMEDIVSKEEADKALCCCVDYLAAAEKELTRHISAAFDTLKKGGAKA